jgi:hypothetical protein
MRVRITPGDIVWARRQDRYNCAIVRAIQREIPEALFVRADASSISYSAGGHRYTYPTPAKVVTEIIKPFDEGAPIGPVEFALVSPTVREVRKLTPERKKQLRTIERKRQKIERSGQGRKEHDRFCDVPEAEAG